MSEFRSQDSLLDDEDGSTQLDAQQVMGVVDALEGETLTYEHDAPLRQGETEEVEVLDVDAVGVEVAGAGDARWEMDWDRALDRTDAAERCEELAMLDGDGDPA